jgi:hypothetical protein
MHFFLTVFLQIIFWPLHLHHEQDTIFAQRLVAHTSKLMGEPLAVQKCTIIKGSDSPGPLVFLTCSELLLIEQNETSDD